MVGVLQRAAAVSAAAEALPARAPGPAWRDRLDPGPDSEDLSFPELACVRPLLAAGVLAAAERRAERAGVGADRALVAVGAIDEESYLRALGGTLGIPFEPLDGMPRAHCPFNNDRLIDCAKTGMLPLVIDDETFVVVAPRGTAARGIIALVKENPAWAQRFRFTSADRMTRFILRGAGKTLAARASEQLRQNWPQLSAAPPLWRGLYVPGAIGASVACGALLAAPWPTVLAVEVLLATMFLAWLGLRLAGAVLGAARAEPFVAQADHTLPVYTVIAALYREARSVDPLLRAIERLDYPAEKLDVILAVEADDGETRAAIAARRTRIPVTVIPVPAAGPRTKPKALNVALPFARGAFTVIYDAEDRPEPDQLRRALQAFGAGEVACVQARLCIDNTADSWLARLFTAEYAGQFDVFLSGLAAMHLPLPLGGSSNHFYTDVLREVGGWDAYNVTEDADLGMRLARFGYRSTLIASTTLEEAPAHFEAWLRQRTRWFKGWMQTWLVHMRTPRRLLRELGTAGFITFQLVVGGNTLAALVHPLFLAGLIYSMATGFPMWRGDGTATALAVLYGSTVVIGYLTSAFLCWLGLYRRALLPTAWVLLLTPVHWLLLSLAAWRALSQLVAAPYTWEKTEHGLAKTSRRAAGTTAALIKLERHLTKLTDAGELPALASDAQRPARAERRTGARAA